MPNTSFNVKGILGVNGSIKPLVRVIYTGETNPSLFQRLIILLLLVKLGVGEKSTKKGI